jgi:hypothetical protein
MDYETRDFSLAPRGASGIDREAMVAHAMRTLASAPALKAEKYLREIHGASPLQARGIVQEAAMRLRRQGVEIYRPATRGRIPGASSYHHIPRDDGDVTD